MTVCPCTQRDGSEGPRSVLVTGGRTGIGLGIARAFLLNGDKVCLVSRSADKAQDNEDIQEYVKKGLCTYLNKDLTQPDQWKSTVEEAVKAMDGKLDVLVNNAGWGKAGAQAMDIDIQLWREHMVIDTDAVFFLSQAAVPHLEKTKGSIVNISSIAGNKATVPAMTYGICKAGVNMITQMMGLELASQGVRVNAINPGMVSSEFFFGAGTASNEEERQKMLKDSGPSYPLGRVGDPQDVASMTLFLADNKAAGWITGQLWTLDGGKTLG